MKYKDYDGYNNFYLVCNYGPAGNSGGAPVYEILWNMNSKRWLLSYV